MRRVDPERRATTGPHTKSRHDGDGARWSCCSGKEDSSTYGRNEKELPPPRAVEYDREDGAPEFIGGSSIL